MNLMKERGHHHRWANFWVRFKVIKVDKSSSVIDEKTVNNWALMTSASYPNLHIGTIKNLIATKILVTAFMNSTELFTNAISQCIKI